MNCKIVGVGENRFRSLSRICTVTFVHLRFRVSISILMNFFLLLYFYLLFLPFRSQLRALCAIHLVPTTEMDPLIKDHRTPNTESASSRYSTA